MNDAEKYEAIEKVIEASIRPYLMSDGGNIELDLVKGDEVVISFDEKTLALALSNLLQNAIKYSPEDSTIKILFTIEKEFLAIEIIDQGIGIPEEQQKYIFDRYFRAENALLNQGTGIGLNISKQHLANLGATLTFVSEENIGSKFTIHIPKNIKSNT